MTDEISFGMVLEARDQLLKYISENTESEDEFEILGDSALCQLEEFVEDCGIYFDLKKRVAYNYKSIDLNAENPSYEIDKYSALPIVEFMASPISKSFLHSVLDRGESFRIMDIILKNYKECPEYAEYAFDIYYRAYWGYTLTCCIVGIQFEIFGEDKDTTPWNRVAKAFMYRNWWEMITNKFSPIVSVIDVREGQPVIEIGGFHADVIVDENNQCIICDITFNRKIGTAC